MKIVKMIDVVGSDVLAGAADGAVALSKLIGKVASIVDSTVVVLDFGGVVVATASFLRESVLGFRDYCRRSRSQLYPVLAAVGPRVREELVGLLMMKGDACVICDLTSTQKIRHAEVVGKLDPKQQLALKAVLKAGCADAGTLARNDPHTRNPTAWNNRLAALSAKGILRETTSGRAKTYEPVVEGLQYGS
jgi:hypothetical protein